MGVYVSKTVTNDGRKYFFKCQYEVYDEDKPRTKVSKKFATAEEAAREERAFLDRVNDLKDCPVDMTFGELYESFRADRKKTVRYSTYRDYYYKHKYIKCFDKVKCVDLTIGQFEIWKAQIFKSKKICLRYKNDILKLLKAIMNYGTKRYNFNFSSIYRKMSKFKDPNYRKPEMKYYTLEEFNKFISVEDNPMWQCFFSTLYFCGLRCGEARALQWSDLDFNKNILSVTKQTQPIPKDYNGDLPYLLLPPKTKTSNRRIPMCDRLVELLKSYQTYLIDNSIYKESNFVFSPTYTIPLKEHQVVARKKYLCKTSGVKSIRTHDFRHSCASLLINNGASVTMVAKFLGHTKVDVTLNTYSHMFQSALDEVINIINDLNNKNE